MAGPCAALPLWTRRGPGAFLLQGYHLQTMHTMGKKAAWMGVGFAFAILTMGVALWWKLCEADASIESSLRKAL